MTLDNEVSSGCQEFPTSGRHCALQRSTSDMHGYLTIDAETTEPFKVVNFGLRAATPEEIKGDGKSTPDVSEDFG
jgi:hypothetical protein